MVKVGKRELSKIGLGATKYPISGFYSRRVRWLSSFEARRPVDLGDVWS
jgi:hypothetical protein